MTGIVDRPEYLLVKRGLYWRPDGQGYTGVKELAGRYFERDANPDSGSIAVHESEAEEFSDNCWPEVAIATLRADNAALREGLAHLVQITAAEFKHPNDRVAAWSSALVQARALLDRP